MQPVALFHFELVSDASTDPDLDPGHRACAVCTGCPKSQCPLIAIAAPSGVDLFQCDVKSCLAIHHSLHQTAPRSKHSDAVQHKEILYL